MNFIEAMKLAIEGKKVTRLGWNKINHIIYNQELLYFCKDTDRCYYHISAIDVLATDWIIEE